MILHVRDISHEDSEAQSRDVEAILGELGVAVGAERVIEVWNKLDKLDPERRARRRSGATARRPAGRWRSPR